jgi:hypothetical protein
MKVARCIALSLAALSGCRDAAPVRSLSAALDAFQLTEPLRHWYSPGRGDHYTTTDPSFQPQPDYVELAPVGFVAAPELDLEQGMVPLVSWYSESLHDHLTTSDPAWAEGTQHGDYVFVRREGGLYLQDPGGAVGLSQWVIGNEPDHATTVDPPGQGAQPVRAEGFIRPPAQPDPLAPTMVRVVSLSPASPWQAVRGTTLELDVQIERLPLEPADQQLFGIDHYEGDVFLEATAYGAADEDGYRPESNVIYGALTVPAGQTTGHLTIDVPDLAGEELYDILVAGYVMAPLAGGQTSRYSLVDPRYGPVVLTDPCGEMCPPHKPYKITFAYVGPIEAGKFQMGFTFLSGRSHPKETGFTIEKRTGVDPWSVAGTLGPSTGPYDPQTIYAKPLDPGTYYCFRINATHAIATTHSDEICTTTRAIPAVPKLTVSRFGGTCDNFVHLSFDYPSAGENTRYILSRTSPTSVLENVYLASGAAGGTHTFNDTTTVPGGAYEYWLSIMDYPVATYYVMGDKIPIKLPTCPLPPPPPPPTGSADLEFDGIIFPSDMVRWGCFEDPMTLNVWVKNAGKVASGKYTNQVLQKDQYSPYYIVEVQLTPKDALGPGGSYLWQYKPTLGAVYTSLDASDSRQFDFTLDSTGTRKTRTATKHFATCF